MRSNHPTRSALPLVPLVLAAGLLLWGTAGSRPVRAEGDSSLVAHSVCEAHELKARKAEDPDLQIQIPKQFDKAWPTAAACASYAAAGNPDTPGPVQPIHFSHKHHAGRYQIDCQYCHSGTERSPDAGVPAVQVCMGCHSQFPKEYDEFKGIRDLKQHWADKTPIEWRQVFWLPEYVQFQHRAHLNAGVTCQTCHGPVETMDKVSITPDTHWWPWGLPTKKLEMGWCINCHRQKGATQDCIGCHY